MKKILTIVAAVAAAAVSASAFDLTVVFRVDETGAKTLKIVPSVVDELTFSPKIEAEVNEADTCFVFRNVPNTGTALIYTLDGEFRGDLLKQPRDSMTFYIPSFYLKDSKELAELVVTASDRSMTNEKETYIPTSRDKRKSDGGVMLLKNIGISTLNVSELTGSVSTVSGDAVSTFIDYRPASRTDIANIRAEDVKSVEVLDFSSDPRFGGAQHVVNFNMVRYEFGGYTKATASQSTLYNTGNYGAYSKFAYKKMVYDVGVSFNYTNNRHCREDRLTIYTFDDETVDSKTDVHDQLSKSHNTTAFFRAIYETSKSSFSNTASVYFDRTPDNYSTASQTFSSPAYISGRDKSVSNASGSSFAWKGDYQFVLPRDWRLAVEPGLSYSKNDNDYFYESGAGDINNRIEEKAWAAQLSATARKRLGRHTLSGRLATELNSNDIDYHSPAPFYEKGRRYYAAAWLQTQLVFDRFVLTPSVTLAVDHLEINGRSRTECQPKYFVSASYLFSPKHRLQFSSYCFQENVPQRDRTESVQLKNQIDAIKGNPDIKMATWLNAQAVYTFMPSSAFTATTYAIFHNRSKALSMEYVPLEVDGRNMMVRTPVNGGHFRELRYGVSLSSKLLDNNLKISLSGIGTYDHLTGPLATSGHHLIFNGDASYSISDFTFSALYQTSNRIYLPTRVTRLPQFYYLSAAWGNGNLHLQAYAFNIFSKSYKGAVVYRDQANYNSTTTTYSPEYHCRFMFSASYSFSYGRKKVNRHIDTNTPAAAGSQILK